MEGGDVAVTDEPLGMLGEDIGWQDIEQLDGAISSSGTHDGLDLWVVVSPLDVGGTLGDGAGISFEISLVEVGSLDWDKSPGADDLHAFLYVII